MPFTRWNPKVLTLRHAVSLDEHRVKFQPHLWTRDYQEQQTWDTDFDEVCCEVALHYDGYLTRLFVQVWFAGCHCGALSLACSQYFNELKLDSVHLGVGGGSVANGTPNSLARIPLRWMVRECFRTTSGIMFTSDGLHDIGLDPATLYPEVQKPCPKRHSAVNHIIQSPSKYPKAYVKPVHEPHKPEEDHELLDALSPIYDPLDLEQGRLWWILEKLPIMHEVQIDDKLEVRRWRNNGQGRIIWGQTDWKVKVHRSVWTRMQALHEDGTKYQPKASFKTALLLGNFDWVD